ESEMSDKSKTSDKSKFDKLVEGGDITLNCIISGGGRNIFDVTISNANNNRVSSLAEAIRNRCLQITSTADLFKDIDSSRLALYKVGFISDNVVILNLSNNEYYEVDGAERMEAQDKIFSHFPIQPQQIYGGEKGINVIVYPPTET
ncbi:12683_t:CDS:1, partial [Funneliformis caledonium]